MSSCMIDDEAAIDKINPFVQNDFSLPGGRRETLKSKFEGSIKDEAPGVAEPEESPICKYGIGAGDNTLDWCSRPKVDKTLPIQKRNIDTGLEPPITDDDDEIRPTILKILCICVVIAALILIVRRLASKR